jgi:hypothetical protein
MAPDVSADGYRDAGSARNGAFGPERDLGRARNGCAPAHGVHLGLRAPSPVVGPPHGALARSGGRGLTLDIEGQIPVAVAEVRGWQRR